MGYQTVIINSKSKLRYQNNNFLIENNENVESVFLENIKFIIINNFEITLSTYLINQLAKYNICIIICDEKNNPNIQLLPLYGSFDCANKINIQIKWSEARKAKLWLLILNNKIENQGNLLFEKGILDFDIRNYIEQICICDEKNVEGTVAKLYFSRLFGKRFNRRQNNNINALLNYGYSIILSIINREIIAQGYITRMGIHHHNKTNLYNLSCDLMEPLRIFVDKIVYEIKDESLNADTKKILINVLYSDCVINNKVTKLYLAIPIYLKSVFEYLNYKIDMIKEINIE